MGPTSFCFGVPEAEKLSGGPRQLPQSRVENEGGEPNSNLQSLQLSLTFKDHLSLHLAALLRLEAFLRNLQLLWSWHHPAFDLMAGVLIKNHFLSEKVIKLYVSITHLSIRRLRP